MRAASAGLLIAAALLVAAGCGRQVADTAVAERATADTSASALTTTLAAASQIDSVPASAMPTPSSTQIEPEPSVPAREHPKSDTPVRQPVADVPAPTATPNPPEIIATDQFDKHCRSDADCAIKDVGSCCGYNPRCVNQDAPTFPEQVKAKCSREGRASICGFPALSGCRCEQGVCTGISAGSSVQ